MSKMVIMRGLPGSGKSTRAREIAAQICATICSTDDFFVVDGKYVFDPSKLGINHALNLKFAQMVISSGRNVIIDNTNVLRSHMQPYIDAAQRSGYEVEIVEVTCDINTCIARNIHGVPEVAIRRMAAQWEEA